MAAREKRWLAVMGLEVTPVDAWRVHAPPGVSTATGALITDLADAGSRYLCADLRYMPPQAGYDVSGVIYGAQPGLSFAGNHYNGGVFDPDTGVQFQEGEKKPDDAKPEKYPGIAIPADRIPDTVDQWNKNACDATIERAQGVGDEGTGKQWESNGVIIKSQEGNINPVGMRRAVDIDGKPTLGWRVWFDVKATNEDEDKWVTVKITCFAEGLFRTKEGNVIAPVEAKRADEEGGKTGRKLPEEQVPVEKDVFLERWYRLPCKTNPRVEVVVTFSPQEVSRVWNEDTGKYEATAGESDYICSASRQTFGEGGAVEYKNIKDTESVKLRAYSETAREKTRSKKGK